MFPKVILSVRGWVLRFLLVKVLGLESMWVLALRWVRILVKESALGLEKEREKVMGLVKVMARELGMDLLWELAKE